MNNNRPDTTMTGRVIAQTIMYRNAPTGLEVLLLLRTEARGGFWSFVNGTVEVGESVHACRVRELQEEAGIAHVVRWTPELYQFRFTHKGAEFTVHACGAEVAADAVITLNDEHTDYAWLSVSAALDRLQYGDDRVALKLTQKYVAR